MKSISKYFLTCVAAALCAAAHAATLPIGYCYGEIAGEGISKVGKATISGAVIIPAEKLAQYQGATVTGIRIGLVTADGVSNLRGWLRDGLSGDNIDESSAVEAADGWNLITLDGGTVIDGSSLTAGFSFDQEKSVKCLSVVGENVDDARWIAKNGKWELAKSRGALSVELMISGDNLPDKDLTIVSIAAPRLPVSIGEDINLSVSVRNMALEPVDGFDIRCDVNGVEVAADKNVTSLAYGDKTSINLSIPGAAMTPDIPLSALISVECDDDDKSNNSWEMPVGSYSESMERRVLVEEFTTEKCGNCPRAINTLKQCEEAGYGDRMTVVAHHVGYYTDWLTVPEDEAYLWLYDPTGTEGTYAPAVMLDRTVLEGATVPVNSIGYFSSFEPMLLNAMDAPAFVDIELASIFVDDDMLDIYVDVERLPILSIVSGTPNITVYVIEDGIPHHDQAGITSDSFTHSHVFRKCVSGIWGDPIAWDGDRASLTYKVPVDPEWNNDNISVVAFVNDYDPENVGRCMVHNSAIAKAGSSGIDNISTDSRDVVSTTFTTPAGIIATDDSKGFLIKTETFSDGSSRTVKIIRK